MDRVDGNQGTATTSDDSRMSRADQLGRAVTALMMVALFVAAVVLTVIAER